VYHNESRCRARCFCNLAKIDRLHRHLCMYRGGVRDTPSGHRQPFVAPPHIHIYSNSRNPWAGQAVNQSNPTYVFHTERNQRHPVPHIALRHCAAPCRCDRSRAPAVRPLRPTMGATLPPQPTPDLEHIPRYIGPVRPSHGYGSGSPARLVSVHG